VNQVIQSSNQYILFDPAFLADDDSAKLFFTDMNDDASDESADKPGRGEARFFQCGPHALVVKHYLRGGWLARFVRDQYYGCDAEVTRAFREWRLLATMREKGLPVPKPVAARVVMKHCFYRADLVTLQIQDARTLSQYLSEAGFKQEGWQAIGECIKRFHRHGVYHADLNASNILINQQQELFVLDFDKGAIKMGDLWKIDNLDRLKRSLLKYKKKNTDFGFVSSDWAQLMSGYIHS